MPSTPSALGWATYSFRERRFVRVDLTFQPRDFDRIATTFVERYGPPTSDRQEPFKTQGGLQSTNRTMTWSGKKIFITVTRYVGMITEGGATITTQEEIREAARLRQERMKGAAKDL